MKKSILPLSLVISLYLSALPISAQGGAEIVGEGYTSDGVYYEAHLFDAFESDEIPVYNSYNFGIKVTREVTYYGNMAPPNELSWRESINGSYYYSGVILLQSFKNTPTQTIALYSGTLYKE